LKSVLQDMGKQHLEQHWLSAFQKVQSDSVSNSIGWHCYE
jgi:hypothetical protein